MSPISLVILDCDGVLVDTERIAVRIDVRVLAELGWPMTEAEVVEQVRRTVIHEVGHHFGISDERLRELGGLFIARRHEIDYLRPALAGDLLVVVTWIAEQKGAQAVREYVLGRLDQQDNRGVPADRFLAPGFALPTRPLVRARTHWAWIGVADSRPRRLPPELRAAFQHQALPQ